MGPCELRTWPLNCYNDPDQGYIKSYCTSIRELLPGAINMLYSSSYTYCEPNSSSMYFLLCTHIVCSLLIFILATFQLVPGVCTGGARGFCVGTTIIVRIFFICILLRLLTKLSSILVVILVIVHMVLVVILMYLLRELVILI